MSEPITDLETAVRELGALPMPVGCERTPAQRQRRTMLDRARDALNARMTKDDLRLVLENVITYAATLETRLAELEAERHTTNEALDDAVQALRAVEARGELGTLPAWLYQRFLPGGVAWEYLDTETRAYWERQARAVQRAVARGGFKDPTPRAEDDVTPQVRKLRNLLAGQRESQDGEHYASVHHSYRVPRDLPPLGGVR